MKKVFTILFCFISIASQAQQFRFGAHVSPQLCWWKVEGDLYDRLGLKPGVQAGLIIDKTFGSTERFAFTSGLNINMAPAGFHTAESGNNGGSEEKEWNFNVMSLDLPLTFRLRSDQLNKTTLFAQYGVTFGFTLAANPKNEDGSPIPNGVDYESMNTSLTMGLGAEYELSNEKSLLFGLFFQNGIVNTLIDNANDDNMFPQELGIHAGLLF